LIKNVEKRRKERPQGGAALFERPADNQGLRRCVCASTLDAHNTGCTCHRRLSLGVRVVCEVKPAAEKGK
jgi:hypothetical protein